ncbi:MAG: hypothetical protein JWQ30_2522 [Sediminibacterium sp.]|nr:hypothetical protein [Sediminibacterium sp.]
MYLKRWIITRQFRKNKELNVIYMKDRLIKGGLFYCA